MKRGFTLIELLVVIAIIAILAAILFPVFARAREKARQTSCLSNIKQITLGVMMYMQDYDEMVPRFLVGSSGTSDHIRAWWGDARVGAYVNNREIFKCPSGKRHSTIRPDYAANYNFHGTWSLADSGIRPATH